jgi:putative transposase
MFRFFRLWFGLLARCFRSHRTLLLENLALRQQLTVLKRRHPKPKLSPLDKLSWVSARRFWSAWKSSLIIVTPETVVRWHRAGFRRSWSLISRVKERVGRKKLSQEIRNLIFQMVTHNSTWGAPRIHGQLLMLGFDVSERSISRWMKRAPQDPGLARRSQAFLRNHREVITAMDFFTVPTVTFNLLYCFFIISHDRRQIVHFNVTQHPTSSWIVQQLREAFPYESAPKFLLFDHDQKYGLEVPAALRSLQITGVQTSIRSPWQNGVAERWVGNCRRDLLDHIIPLNARHLKRLLSTYASYYHDDRTHLGLHKETPGCRIRSGATGPVICHARLGGLHHRYDRAA